MIGILLTTYAWYLASVLGRAAGGSLASVRYQDSAVVAAVGVVALAAFAHVMFAALGRGRTTGTDVTARSVKRYARSTGGVVITASAVLAMALAMLEVEPFWIANLLLAGLVLAELASAASEILVYRRSV